MLESIRDVSYITASLLFVLSLRGLGTQESARGGNLLGTVGMGLAVVATAMGLFFPRGFEVGVVTAGLPSAGLQAVAIGVGAVVGAALASRVAMTAMPELVAVLHSFVGLAAVLVGIGTNLVARREGHADLAHEVEVYLGVLVGAVTFTGSIVAFLKLRGTLGSRPLLLPARHALNVLMVAACIALGVLGYQQPGTDSMPYLLAMTAIASLLGVHLVAAIGGGDMPVVVSLLNSYSGWAASAAGFMLDNDLLIVTGALVGSSGAILSFVMCRAMNRSIWNVVFGGFGAEPASGGKAKAVVGTVTETSVGDVAELLSAAKSVVVIPGYGMAVAQAQHPVQSITAKLIERGVKVRYAIHPVAGRLPGHMNVLLAEANVPYDIVVEMEDIQEELHETDVVLVIGANDIVNPSALDDPESPIYGMPVLEAWKATKVVMLKRGMAAGYAGVDNPLCYRENTLMLFGDAKQSVTKLALALEKPSG